MNLLAPSLTLVVLTVAAFALVAAGVMWLLRRVWRGSQRSQAGSARHVAQRLERVEADLRALEDSTDYLADALRVPLPPGQGAATTPRDPGDAR